MTNKKKLVLLIISVIVLIAFAFSMLMKNNQLFNEDMPKELKTTETIQEMSKLEYEADIDDILKAQSFIQSKMYTDIFWDSDAHDGFEDSVAIEELRREPLLKLQQALLFEDVDAFIFVTPTSSLQKIFDANPDIEKRIESLQATLKVLNRDNTFKSLSYQFYEDQNKNETNNGVLHLHYEGSDTVVVPFELEQVGDDPHHLYFKFVSPLADIEGAIKRQK